MPHSFNASHRQDAPMTCSINVSNSANSKVPILDISELEIGTQVSVECSRNGVTFDHHGVFIGCLQPAVASHMALLEIYSNLVNVPCVIDFNANSEINIASVADFCAKSTLYAHFYRTMVFEPHEIVHRAISAFAGKEKLKYDELNFNCEHFATKIVRDEAVSNQSSALVAGLAAGADASKYGAAAGAGVAVLAGCSAVTVAEVATVPLWGSSLLGAMGLTQTTVVTSTVTAFEAGLVSCGMVTGLAVGGAILAGSIVALKIYVDHKKAEKYERFTSLRKKEQALTKNGLTATNFDCNAINIAFCGGTGRGKSTCINAVLKKKAAVVSSSGEGTTQICKFETCLSDRKLVLYDLPGAGTAAHPEHTYWADKKLGSFNVLLVFLEIGQLLDFERDIIQHAISLQYPPLAVVFGQVDQIIRKLVRKGSSPVEALAQARSQAEDTMRTSFRFHAGEALPPSFLISQRQWCNGKFEYDESSLAAFLMRHAAEAEIPDDEINVVLKAIGMPQLPVSALPGKGKGLSCQRSQHTGLTTEPQSISLSLSSPRCMVPTGASVPEPFKCPITLEIMLDPVATADGQTYERAAITDWLADHDTSPLSGASLQSKELVPNVALRQLIVDFSAMNPSDEAK